MSMLSPFAWLRAAARNSVLGGIQEALEQVAADPEAFGLKPLALPAIPAPSLPAAPVEEEKPTRKVRA
jgi:hypothetical protein